MKIQLPIDTSAVSFIDVMPPEPVLDGHTKQQKADANGELLYSVELVCIGTEGDEILSVTFPGPPPAGIRQGMPVRVTGLMVTGGAIGDRFGLTFRAADIEPLSAADAETGRQPSSGAAGLNRWHPIFPASSTLLGRMRTTHSQRSSCWHCQKPSP